MTADPFEEFEFRPLTEGLGFHRKNESKQASAPAPASFEMNAGLPEIEMPLRQPLRRPTPEPAQAPTESSTTVDEILKTLQNKRRLDFEETKKPQPAAPALRMSAPGFSSAILDGMLVVAGTLCCLIILLTVTKVDLFGLLTQSEDLTLSFAFYALFAGVAWIYLVVNRLFLGFTPGEWVFDQRVGLPQNHGSAGYSMRVVLRSTLVVATGLFPIPLLSMIVRRDLAGLISGVNLLKKV
jgi:hypothetical protein